HGGNPLGAGARPGKGPRIMSLRRGWWAVPIVAMGLGCGLGPKNFRSLVDPAPMVRARAVGMGRHMPDSVVIPALIERLEDRDPVVRLSAHEELVRRTGQNFGWVSYADPGDRAQAVERWRAWWEAREAGPGQTRRIP